MEQGVGKIGLVAAISVSAIGRRKCEKARAGRDGDVEKRVRVRGVSHLPGVGEHTIDKHMRDCVPRATAGHDHIGPPADVAGEGRRPLAGIKRRDWDEIERDARIGMDAHADGCDSTGGIVDRVCVLVVFERAGAVANRIPALPVGEREHVVKPGRADARGTVGNEDAVDPRVAGSRSVECRSNRETIARPNVASRAAVTGTDAGVVGAVATSVTAADDVAQRERRGWCRDGKIRKHRAGGGVAEEDAGVRVGQAKRRVGREAVGDAAATHDRHGYAVTQANNP